MLTALLLAVAIADVRPNFATQAVSHDADDPAVWVHPTRPERSLIIGTDKQEGPGGLFVALLHRRSRHTPSPGRFRRYRGLRRRTWGEGGAYGNRLVPTSL